MPGLIDAMGSQPLEVTIGGQALNLARTSTVTISHGRGRADEQPEAASAQVACYADALTSLPDVGDALTVHLGATARDYLGLTDLAAWEAARPRFVGTVSDVRAVPGAAGLAGAGILTVTATGPKARLGRLIVGDVPWPAELDGARADRILQAAQTASGGAYTLGPIDPGTVTVLGRDVDAQPALGLLDELAQQAGAVFVARRDGALEWHDAEHRRGVTQNALQLSAQHVLRDAVWEQTLAGLVNDLTLTYGPEGTSGQAEVRSQDGTSVTAYGRVASRLTSQLLDSATAQARLGELLGRRSRPRWQLTQLALEVLRALPPALAAQVAAVELGRLIVVTGFPESGPFVTARLYVEGWQETFSRDSWRVQLSVSEYALTGPAPRWADVRDVVTWATFPADVSWLAAVGWYPGDPLTGRWLDIPADQSWAEQPDTITWATADALWPA